MSKSQEVERKPYNPQDVVNEINESFSFSTDLTEDQKRLCLHIEAFGRAMATEIAHTVPEGREQIIAINNILAAVMWSRHAIIKQPQIVLVATDPVPEMRIGQVGDVGVCGCPAGEQGPLGCPGSSQDDAGNPL